MKEKADESDRKQFDIKKKHADPRDDRGGGGEEEEAGGRFVREVQGSFSGCGEAG